MQIVKDCVLLSAIFGGNSKKKTMTNFSKSIYSKEYQALIKSLKDLRIDSQLTQRELAKILGVPHSMVGKIEIGARKLDVFELISYLEPFDVDSAKFIQHLVKSKP